MRQIVQNILSMGAILFIITVLSLYEVQADTNKVFVVTTDYESGGHAVCSSSSLSAISYTGTVFQDAVARSFGDHVYVIERWHGDNILVFHKNNLHDPVRQFSVGNGTNPHDFLLLSSDKAYVTLYEESELIIVNPGTGQITGKIDLSAFADADGIPEMDLMVLHNNKVFVSLQRLDRTNMFQPSGLSKIAVIDPLTDTIIDTDLQLAGIQAIDLTMSNPVDMQYVPGTGKILIAEAGSFYTATDGGLEYINPATYIAEGIIMTEMELGGQVGGASGAFSMISKEEGYAIIMTGDWIESRVVQFSLNTRRAYSVHAPGTGFVHADILTMDDRLYVCDRTLHAPGIRVFNTQNDHELTMIPVDTGLPPFCLTAVGTLDIPDNESSVSPDLPEPDNETTPEGSMQFVTAVVSSSANSVFTDVFIFNDDGSFVLKKFEQYGSGEFYYITPYLFYFVFNNGAATDIQYIQGVGIVTPGLSGRLLVGAGSFMVDYSLVPMIFAGKEVLQK